MTSIEDFMPLRKKELIKIFVWKKNHLDKRFFVAPETVFWKKVIMNRF
jgi:hypothetical protein